MLPFLCCIENEAEIDQPEMWEKANPSLRYLPNLRAEMERQYQDYKRQTSGNLEFPTKRLNYPIENKAAVVTEYKNLLATKKVQIYVARMAAIIGLDFAARRDFAVAGYLTRGENGVLQWREHAFVLKNNPDLERIQAPLEEWEAKGILTFLDGVEINPQSLMDWLIGEQQEKGIEYIAAALDMYRYGIVKKHLNEMGFESGKDGNLKLVRPSDLMIAAPAVMSTLDNQMLACGDDPFFRWCANNVKLGEDKHKNATFEKIEGKSRKTDGFMAFAAAMTLEELLPIQSATENAVGVYFA